MNHLYRQTIGKTIQIYCPSGDPRGVRIAEITTSVPQAIVIPRAKLDEATTRPELARVGLYFLFGPTDDGIDEQVYIGEADDCLNRLADHSKSAEKRFWQVAIVVVSSKATLTKGHVRLLEHWAIHDAKAADRYFIVNGTSPAKPPVPEAMEAECAEVYNIANILLSTLGYPVFEPIVPVASSLTTDKPIGDIYTCEGNGFAARMTLSDAGYVVLQGSMAREKIAQSAQDLLPLRESLMQNGVIYKTENGLMFNKNHAFKSPSAAACFITGTSCNGWDRWIASDGRTLDQVIRKQGLLP
jgi:hypothetical protein